MEGAGLELDLGFNPLPASYRIRFKVSDDRSLHISEFAEKIRGKPGVESVEYGEKWIGRFEKFMIICRVFLLGVGALLSLGLTLIISNTIRLSIYSRQDEIELMLLIGATPRFVKIPFLLEGVLQGLSGSFFPTEESSFSCLAIFFFKIFNSFFSSFSKELISLVVFLAGQTVEAKTKLETPKIKVARNKVLCFIFY